MNGVHQLLVLCWW